MPCFLVNSRWSCDKIYLVCCLAWLWEIYKTESDCQRCWHSDFWVVCFSISCMMPVDKCILFVYSKLTVITCHTSAQVGTKLSFSHSGQLVSQTPCHRQVLCIFSLCRTFYVVILIYIFGDLLKLSWSTFCTFVVAQKCDICCLQFLCYWSTQPEILHIFEWT